MFDIIIIGAGPIGIACGIEAQKQGYNYIIIEKGCLTNTIFHFPVNMTFFSTADLLEIGDIPFIIPDDKPKRVDALKYYRRVTEHYKLNIHLDEKVENVSGAKDNFKVLTPKNTYDCRRVIITTGFYDNPKHMNIPGEDIEKVSHYYQEPHAYYRKDVLIIGSGNSSIEAALELYRYNAHVTMVHRGDTFTSGAKYWILPDIENRIKEGSIEMHFNTHVKEIKESSVTIVKDNEEIELKNDYVLALTGYRPDVSFLQKIGIKVHPQSFQPYFNEESMETDIPGIYVAGQITESGSKKRVFIENGRIHAKILMEHIGL